MWVVSTCARPQPPREPWVGWRRPSAKQACTAGLEPPAAPARLLSPPAGIPGRKASLGTVTRLCPGPARAASPCWLGRGCGPRGTKARAPPARPPGCSFSSQTLTVSRVGWRRPAGTAIDYLRASMAQTKGPPATGAAAGDPREKVPRGCPRQWKGVWGLGQKCFSIWCHGGCISAPREDQGA